MDVKAGKGGRRGHCGSSGSEAKRLERRQRGGVEAGWRAGTHLESRAT